MRKIYALVKLAFRKIMRKHDQEKVTVEVKELDKDQVPESIRKAIEAKEKELKKEAQM